MSKINCFFFAIKLFPYIELIIKYHYIMLSNISQSVNGKPFLRWAGGKSWLIKHLSSIIPHQRFNSYHEPFLGGAAIFFHLKPKNAHLSDLNQDLIDCYLQVRDNPEAVISELRHFENTEEFYYDIRGKAVEDQVLRAAKFIYLNQTSFNGIYRVNLQGVYNVPFGYRSKDFYDAGNLRAVSQSLSSVNIYQSDFNNTIDTVQPGDLVFLDPPYTVTHNHNGFVKYNKKLFDLDSQHLLSAYIDKIKEKGAFYILTNAAHQEVKKIFAKEGDTMTEINRASLIGGKNAKRGNYAELIITNIK